LKKFVYLIKISHEKADLDFDGRNIILETLTYRRYEINMQDLVLFLPYRMNN